MTAMLIERAVQVLKSGGLVALPTETVYGLGADASNELAVRRIFSVKQRPSSHPLIVHLGSATELEAWASEVSPLASKLAKAFWPGPLTLVLKRTSAVSDAVTGGLDTVAVRVPKHPLALELLRAFRGGIAAPSANRFGKVSPTTAAHVRTELGDEVELLLDGGPCAVGVESTIVDVSGPRPLLLRPGGITPAQLQTIVGEPVALASADEGPHAPGRLASHYAPRAGLKLSSPEHLVADAQSLAQTGAKVAILTADPTVDVTGCERLPIPQDVAQLAKVLYAMLRRIDDAGFDVAVIELPSEDGLGLAVRDRLMKAASPRA